jgi:DNA-binding LacI/PurR family transcriptional regulator
MRAGDPVGHASQQPQIPQAESAGRKARYRAIYEALRSDIRSGVYRDGDRLPYERELCEHHQVDRITVRRALDLLVADQLVEKRAGLGTFVQLAHTGAHTAEPARQVLFIMAKNSNEIGSNPSAFNSELFYAVEQACRLKNIALRYAVLDQEEDLAGLLGGSRPTCLFFVSSVPVRVLDRCVALNLPAILLNNRDKRMISIVPEDERGAYDATAFLLDNGHRKIAALLGRAGYYSTKERQRGFCAALHDAGLAVNPDWLLSGDWTFAGAHLAVLSMLDRLALEQWPTALFCHNDIMAIGAIDALRERGLSVPEQISVIGFDDVQQAVYITPRLTTIAIDVRLMARLAVDHIADAVAGTDTRYLIVIPAALVQRQSVQPPK